MKLLLAGAVALVVAGTLGVNAQSAGPYNSNTIHQSAGDRDSRGYPKYQHSTRTRHHRHMMSTTGAGDFNRGQAPGPYYSNSIHQSAGDRDSRDYPKYQKH
jgi:hypothetical protein